MLGDTLLEGHPVPNSEDVKASTKIHASLEDEVHHSMDVRKLINFVGAAYFVIMTAFIVPFACLATVVLLFPLMYFSLSLFNYLENRLCMMVNNHWVSASVYCGLNIVEYGCDLSAYTDKRCLFLVNHLGLTDHFMVMQALHNKGMVSGNWMWVIYNIWKYTPLGFMWRAHGNFFINGGPSRKTAVLNQFRKHLATTFYKFNYRWIVMYPEGSRLFLMKESGARFAEKMRLRPLHHCAYPRSGAAHAVLDVLGPRSEKTSDSNVLSRCGGGEAIEYIIDATLGYPKGAVPNIGTAMLGEWPYPCKQLCVYYEVHKVDPAWADETCLQSFLYKRYQEKDKLLHNFYNADRFPGGPRPVVVSQVMMLFSQVFWILLYYAHYTIWLRPVLSYIFTIPSKLF